MERRGEKTENVNICWICERTSRQYNEEYDGENLEGENRELHLYLGKDEKKQKGVPCAINGM